MKCNDCYFWSELVAMAKGDGDVSAMCLNDNSNDFQKMTFENHSCEDWELGNGESIDSP